MSATCSTRLEEVQMSRSEAKRARRASEWDLKRVVSEARENSTDDTEREEERETKFVTSYAREFNTHDSTRQEKRGRAWREREADHLCQCARFEIVSHLKHLMTPWGYHFNFDDRFSNSPVSVDGAEQMATRTKRITCSRAERMIRQSCRIHTKRVHSSCV